MSFSVPATIQSSAVNTLPTVGATLGRTAISNFAFGAQRGFQAGQGCSRDVAFEVGQIDCDDVVLDRSDCSLDPGVDAVEPRRANRDVGHH